MSKTIIITAAITGGVHTPTMSPYLPITPDEIAADAVRAYEAGAAVAHIHVRDPQTGKPVPNMDYFLEVAQKIKSRCEMVLCITTGGAMGMTPEQRLKIVPALQPELASFNCGSLNFSVSDLAANIKEFKFEWERTFLESSEDNIFPNTFKSMRIYCKTMRESETKPELEIYDVSHINNVVYMLNAGLLERPVHFQFVMGILGGIPATVENLVFLHGTARKTIGDFTWSVAAAGKNQLPMAAAALAMGGNVRVGLEDNLFIGKGILAKSNAEQVEKVVRIARELGLEPATPDQARKILGLKGIHKVSY